MDGCKYAVLIASSQFKDEPRLPPLSAPENDVDELAEVLSSPERGGFSEVVVLKNRPQHEVLRQIQRTLNQATKNDLVVLYYSGHGKLNRAGRLYLTANDTILSELESSAVAVASLRDFVDASSVQRVVVILDSCFSGAIGDVFSKGAVDDQLQLASAQGRGTYYMTASTGIQTAQEKEADRHSVFTKHLIAGIRSGEADTDRDGQITADELYDYVHRHVRMESHQEPTRWGEDVRGHLVLAKSGKEPRRERAEELRRLLLTLANEKRVTDNLLTEALDIIKQPLASLNTIQSQRDALLEELRLGKIDALQLVVRWVELTGRKIDIAPQRARQSAKEPPTAAREGIAPAKHSAPAADDVSRRAQSGVRRAQPPPHAVKAKKARPAPAKSRADAGVKLVLEPAFDPGILQQSVVRKVIVQIVLIWAGVAALMSLISILGVIGGYY